MRCFKAITWNRINEFICPEDNTLCFIISDIDITQSNFVDTQGYSTFVLHENLWCSMISTINKSAIILRNLRIINNEGLKI